MRDFPRKFIMKIRGVKSVDIIFQTKRTSSATRFLLNKIIKIRSLRTDLLLHPNNKGFIFL